MALNSFLSNQGTQSALLTDNTGGVSGTLVPVMKIDTSAQGTANSLWNGNVGISSGTVNVSTISSLPNLPGGTLNVVAAGTINAATAILNNGTINLATVQMSSGTLNVATISSLPNLPQGSINVTAGTINTGTVNTGTINTGTINVATIAAGSIIQTAGTTSVGTVNTGTVNTGTINVATVTSGSIVVTAGTFVNNGGSAIAYGPAAAAAAAAGNPLNVGGTDSGGTIRTLGVDSSGRAQVVMQVGTVNVATISSLPNLPQGSINVTAGTIGTVTNVGQVYNAGTLQAGTINTGTINTGTINLGTIVGKDANAAAQTGNPIGIGGTDSGGTIRTVLVNSAGAMSVSGASSGTFNNITTGTLNVSTVNTGTINTGTVNVATVTAGSIIVTAGTVAAGTINTGTLNTGTVNLGSMVKITAAPTAGSFTAAGTITVAGSQLDYAAFDAQGTWVGTVFTEAQIGTSAWFALPYITPTGTWGTSFTGNGDYFVSMAGVDGVRARLTYSSGTLTYNARQSNFFAPMHYAMGGTIGNVGMLNGGTINTGTIAAGSIVITAGTQSVGTINTGTINVATVNNGSIVVTAGTISAGTINTGTINTGTFAMTVGTINAGTLKDNLGAIGTFTITVGTLASSSSGVGRQSTLIDNTTNLYSGAIVAAQITVGTVTTANNLISLYLIRSDNGGGPIADDKAGASDAGWTQINAPLLGNILVNAVGTNVQYQAVFDTAPLGHLGPKWGVGVVHNMGNPLNPTSGSHSITYNGYNARF